MELEDFFCSKVRMKILKLLFRLGQLNTSDLARRVGTNYAITLKHLSLLEKEDIIEQRLSGRTRFSDLPAIHSRLLLEDAETIKFYLWKATQHVSCNEKVRELIKES